MSDDGWRREALFLRKQIEEGAATMNALADLFEANIAHVNSPMLCLAFHHVAMNFRSYARKKTLAKALKAEGGIEELSKIAPVIFPPNRVPKMRPRKR
jgi:hypothetical protein